jgi:hypothetical protein
MASLPLQESVLIDAYRRAVDLIEANRSGNDLPVHELAFLLVASRIIKAMEAFTPDERGREFLLRSVMDFAREGLPKEREGAGDKLSPVMAAVISLVEAVDEESGLLSLSAEEASGRVRALRDRNRKRLADFESGHSSPFTR